MICGIWQTMRASWRACRRRIVLVSERWRGRGNDRSHCWAAMAKNAARRLSVRLRNQSAFIAELTGSGWNTGRGVRDWVALTKPGVIVNDASWSEMRSSSSADLSPESSCNSWYDSAAKVVTTAENKPAYGIPK